MSDLKTLLERADRAAADVPLPAGGLDGLERRRDRKRRNQRIRAGVLGLAIAIAVGWLGVNAIRSSSPVPADPTPRPPGIFAPVGGWITYGDKDGIWAVNPAQRSDPSDQILLSPEQGDPLAWSPDGSKLLVRSQVPRGKDFGHEDLYLLDADGAWNRLTDADGGISGGSFSPDGTEVVYAVFPYSGHRGIYVADVEGGAPRLVTKDVAYPYYPTFSPDGSQIAYFDGHGDWGNRIRVMNADGSDVRNVTGPDYGHVDGLAWSPDGSRLAFSLQGGGIWIVGVDGSGLTELIPGGVSPAWSPDGARISFQLMQGPLEIVTLDGGDIQEFGYGASGPWNPIEGEKGSER